MNGISAAHSTRIILERARLPLPKLKEVLASSESYRDATVKLSRASSHRDIFASRTLRRKINRNRNSRAQTFFV